VKVYFSCAGRLCISLLGFHILQKFIIIVFSPVNHPNMVKANPGTGEP
jgi:hypothetical protein